VTVARQRLGRAGESLAARWYEDRGYRVVARRWRGQGRAGELDLVVRRGSLLAFCEVKARTSTAFGSPALAVGLEKQGRLRELAGEFLRRHPQRGVTDHRFDVAAVVGDDVELIEAAF
jgi:putative endonuclease